MKRDENRKPGALSGSCPDDASIYIFDFCGTVFRSRTTPAFLAFLRRRASFPYGIRFYACWVVASALRRLRLIDPPGYMRFRVRCLKGLSRGFLAEQADAFVGSLLAMFRRDEELDLMRDLLAGGKRVVIASFTLDVILEAFTKHVGVEWAVGSSLQFDSEGYCGGRYAEQLKLRGKLSALLDAYDKEILRNAFLLTDDAEADSDLFGYVGYPVLVGH